MNSWLLGKGRFARTVKRSSAFFDSDGLRIHAYQYCAGKPDRKPALLVCHGFTADSLELSGIARKLAEYGFLTLNIEARGRGESEGDPEDTCGYVRDALRAVDYLSSLPIDRKRIGVIGQSLGSGVAVLAAAEDPRLQVCVALHPYSRLLRLGRPAEPGELDVARPAEHVARISPRPLLIIAGESDDVLPVTLAHELYEAAGEPKRMVVIRHGTHSIEDAEMYALGWLLTNL